ncbi:MAG: dihydropteroate synthase, partial [Candidatus Solibacter sp.]
RSGPPRGDRPSYGPPRGDRPSYGPPRGDRPDRPSYDRGDRPNKPNFDRSGPPRGDRPNKPWERSGPPQGDRQNEANFERSGPPRGDNYKKPIYDRADHPAAKTAAPPAEPVAEPVAEVIAEPVAEVIAESGDLPLAVVELDTPPVEPVTETTSETEPEDIDDIEDIEEPRNSAPDEAEAEAPAAAIAVPLPPPLSPPPARPATPPPAVSTTRTAPVRSNAPRPAAAPAEVQRIRKLFFWKLKQREIRLGERTILMAVLNVTPDSFSDGGKYSDPDRAYARAIELEELGADIIDVGAESTRPGSARVSLAEEIRRLIPVLKRLKDKLTIPISIDTYKAEVAERAFDLGAEIINDPSCLTFEPQLAKTVAQFNGGLILNHMRGTPETWAKLGPIADPIGAIARDLDATVNRARRAGVDKVRMVIDPGLGFGKRKEENSAIIAHLGHLNTLELPIMVGPSRKSFLAHPDLEETKYASAGAVTAAILAGAHIVRVHDVREMRAASEVADEILRSRQEQIIR